MKIIVEAPMRTREILQLLQGWEPFTGVKFILDHKKSYLLTFEVTTPSSTQALHLAQQRLADAGYAELPGLKLSAIPE